MGDKIITAVFLLLLLIRPFLSSVAFPQEDIIFTILLLGSSLLLLEKKKFSLNKSKSFIFAILLLLAILISVCFSINVSNSVSNLYKFSACIITFFSVSYLRPIQRRALVITLFFSGYLVALFAVIWHITGTGALIDYMHSNHIKWGFAFEYLSRGRAFAPFFLPSSLAGYLTMILPIGFALLSLNKHSLKTNKKSKIIKYLLYTMILIILLAIAATQSLGAILSLMAASCIYLLFRAKRFNPLLALGGILSFLVVFFLFLLARYANTHSFNFPFFSITNRLSYWHHAILDIKMHPFTGFGLGNFPFYKSLSAHNSYLQIWAETGILGFISLVAISYYSIKTRFLSSPGSRENIIFNALWIGNLTFLIHNLIDFTLFLPEVSLQWWIITALLINYSQINKQNQ